MGKHEEEQKEITVKDLYKLIKDSTEQNIKIQSQIKQEIKNLKEDIFSKLNNLEKVNRELKEENKKLKTSLLSIERKQKKFNIVIYGLPDEEKDILSSAINIFKNNLKINCVENDIRDIYKIGAKSQDRPRPTVVEFVSCRLKTNIINKTGELKNSGIFITHDYTAQDYQDKKFLMRQLKIAKEEYPEAKIKKNILIVNEEKFTLDELKQTPFQDKLPISKTLPIENAQGTSFNTELDSNAIKKQVQEQKNRRGAERTDHQKVIRSSSRAKRF